MVAGGAARSIDEILGAARARLRRLGPLEAREAIRSGALLVDIRPQARRAEQGLVPGALHVERNVLEWRFDPRSAARLPQAGSALHVILMCVEGYTSSLAAFAAGPRRGRGHRPGGRVPCLAAGRPAGGPRRAHGRGVPTAAAAPARG